MKEKKIKLIIFDAYGVCISKGYPDTAKFLGKKFRMDQKKIFKVLYTKWFNRAAVRTITQEQSWMSAIAELKLPITTREIKNIHYGLMVPNFPVLRLAKLLNRKYEILLLSKSTRTQFHDFHKRRPEVKKVFGENMINTWEYKLPKASKATVKFISERFGVKPDEMVYIDDQESNLEEPRKLGVKTIFYENFAQFKKELLKLLS